MTERLVQRLLCGAAQIDPRFSSKYLINNRLDQNDVRKPLNSTKTYKTNFQYTIQTTTTHLEYLLRLDALSTPTIYESDDKPVYEILETDKDCPAGYARIRLSSSTYKVWEEFINSFGFLRRYCSQKSATDYNDYFINNQRSNSSQIGGAFSSSCRKRQTSFTITRG